MIRIVFVASGSKGNATLITDGESLIQIDMGVPRKTLAKGTKILGKSVEDIEALFIKVLGGSHQLPWVSSEAVDQKNGLAALIFMEQSKRTGCFYTIPFVYIKSVIPR